MPKMTECKIGSVPVSVVDAINLRDGARQLSAAAPDFRCPECNGTVRPHRAATADPAKYPAHFEHLERDASCSLSHIARG